MLTRTLSLDSTRGEPASSAHATPTPGPALLVARAQGLLRAVHLEPEGSTRLAQEAQTLLAMLRQAARALPEHAPAAERAAMWEALGLGLRDLPANAPHPQAGEALRRAIAAWDAARDPEAANRVRVALAELLVTTAGAGRPAALREAVGLLRAAVDRGTPHRDPVRWAEQHLLFAEVLQDLVGPGPSPELEAALMHYEVALAALPPSEAEARLWALLSALRALWMHRGPERGGADLVSTVRTMWPLLHEATLLANERGPARGLVCQLRGELMLALVGPEQPRALEDARRALRLAREDLQDEHPALRAPVCLALGLALATEPCTAAERVQAAAALAEALTLPLTRAQQARAQAGLERLARV